MKLVVHNHVEVKVDHAVHQHEERADQMSSMLTMGHVPTRTAAHTTRWQRLGISSCVAREVVSDVLSDE